MFKPGLSATLEILATQGHQQYGGEAVTQLEHALQCATLAQTAGATPELITACLLHDLGHLVHDLGEEAAAQGIDDRHEYRAIPWLKLLFSPAVTEPIRLHVQAKCYLCAIDTNYFTNLSAASQRSLTLQGGIFSPEQAAAFIALPYAEAAIRLRHWDEAAKVPKQPTPSLTEFEPILRTCLRQNITGTIADSHELD